MLEIKLIETEKELKALYSLAETEIPLFPSHILVKASEIVGYLSCARMPLFYMQTKESVTTREKYTALKFGEENMLQSGHKHPMILTSENCPYYPYLNKLGYIRSTGVDMTLLLKK